MPFEGACRLHQAQFIADLAKEEASMSWSRIVIVLVSGPWVIGLHWYFTPLAFFFLWLLLSLFSCRVYDALRGEAGIPPGKGTYSSCCQVLSVLASASVFLLLWKLSRITSMYIVCGMLPWRSPLYSCYLPGLPGRRKQRNQRSNGLCVSPPHLRMPSRWSAVRMTSRSGKAALSMSPWLRCQNSPSQPVGGGFKSSICLL